MTIRLTSPSSYGDVLRRNLLVVVGPFVLALAAAALVTSLQTSVYRASMKVVVGQGNGFFQPQFGSSVQPFTQTMTSLLESEVVAQSVIDTLGLDTTPKALLSATTVSANPESSVLDVSYDSPDKEQAVRVLTALGDAFTRLVRQKLSGPTGKTAGSPITANVFDPAHLEPGRVSPRPTRNLVVAGLLGLLIGGVLAALRESVNVRLRTRDDAEAWFRAPVIGVIPKMRTRRRATLLGRLLAVRGNNPLLGTLQALRADLEDVEEWFRAPPASGPRPRTRQARGRARAPRPLFAPGNRSALDALHMLRSNLEFSEVAARGPIVVVTSAIPDEGKSTIVADLGTVLALAGKHVVCVEADLRRPKLGDYLGVAPGGANLFDFLHGTVPVSSAMQEVPLTAADALGEPIRPGKQLASGRLQVVLGGSPTAEVGEIFRRDAVDMLVSDLRKGQDYVLFDTPPVLLAGDSFPLLLAADIVLIAAREGHTTRAVAEGATAILDGLGIQNRAVVLTAASSSGAYGHYGRYARPSEPSPTAARIRSSTGS